MAYLTLGITENEANFTSEFYISILSLYFDELDMQTFSESWKYPKS